MLRLHDQCPCVDTCSFAAFRRRGDRDGVPTGRWTQHELSAPAWAGHRRGAAPEPDGLADGLRLHQPHSIVLLAALEDGVRVCERYVLFWNTFLTEEEADRELHASLSPDPRMK
eukprot:SAG11_NODE_2811_length_2947_cov_3.850720_2_plen_114_part_00